MDEGDWPSDWLRAALTMTVLTLLSEGDNHGYAILKALRGRGLGDIKGSTLYPLLARQQAVNHVGHRWDNDGSGPGRKIFFLTPAGRTEAANLQQRWTAFVDVLTGITDHRHHEGES